MSGGEIVDIVDAEDCVVGQATRARVRAENLWHRACYVVALNEEGRIFIHLRTAHKDVFPSHYDTVVGGVLASGESYREAAEREVLEELGVEPRGLTRIGGLRYEDASNRVIGEIYECIVEPPLRLQPEEVVSGEWLTAEEVSAVLARRPFCPDGIVAFGEWLRWRGD